MTDKEIIKNLQDAVATAEKKADAYFVRMEDAEAKARDCQNENERLRETLACERDCVLRQQREINHLKQHIADTPAAVLA